MSRSVIFLFLFFKLLYSFRLRIYIYFFRVGETNLMKNLQESCNLKFCNTTNKNQHAQPHTSKGNPATQMLCKLIFCSPWFLCDVKFCNSQKLTHQMKKYTKDDCYFLFECKWRRMHSIPSAQHGDFFSHILLFN